METKEYKKTLILPSTDFDMRANLIKKDEKLIDYYTSINLINRISSKSKKIFILHDGPPYANGDLHIGHALNKILKDFNVRFNLLKGLAVSWKPGWDTHGLPIENEITKQNKLIGKDINYPNYIKMCKDYALNQVEKQQEQFKKLNLLADFDNRYLTLYNKYVKSEIEIFHKLLNDKLIYKDLKPVYWSWSSKTALAESEIEYKDVEEDTIYIKFKFNNLFIVVWTTTPWTLYGNTALAFNRKLKYSIYMHKGDKLVISDDLFNSLSTKIDLEFIEYLDVDEIINQYAINPLNQNKSLLLFSDHVKADKGTGIIHIAGGHGIDDYNLSKKHNLIVESVVDDLGHIIAKHNPNRPFYTKENMRIIKDLDDDIILSEKINHSVPIDWRTKKRVMYRATFQWFISLSSIRTKLLKGVDDIEWIPKWGNKKMKSMIESRDDWCISRQRLWGVSIPIIYDEYNKPIVDKELQRNIENLYDNENFLWRDIDIKKVLPNHIKYSSAMKIEKDILDVWFDSGSSHNFLNIKSADLYLEGIDQYRGWFSSSLITSIILNDRPSFKRVITHNFIVDKNGNKMSKSKGNIISLEKITKQYGSDIIKLFIANSNYKDNIKLSDEALIKVSLDYRKIRNTLRFILGNLNDYNFLNDIRDSRKLTSSRIINSIMFELDDSFSKIIESYSKGNYLYVIKKILNDIVSGNISYILEYSKEILYTYPIDSSERKEIQLVLHKILMHLCYAIAPIIPTTIEEVFVIITKNLDSIFLSDFEKVGLNYKTAKDNVANNFFQIRDQINKKIEKLREDKIVNKSHEVEVTLTLSKDFSFLAFEDLKNLLMVGHINLILSSSKMDDMKIEVKKFNGHKCERCWKLFNKQNISKSICETCKKALGK